MSAVEITESRIKADLRMLVSKSQKQIENLKRHIDFKGIVEPLFKQKDYSYTLSESGDFSILAAPGMLIKGQWEKVNWEINFEINYGSNSLTTNEDILKMSPASFMEYGPVFDSMISYLQNIYNEYTDSTKSNKKSQLLSQLVKQSIKKLKISETSLTPNDQKDGLLKLERRIAGNLYITTVLDFDNYEERCQELKEVLSIFPPIIEEKFFHSIFYKSRFATDWDADAIYIKSVSNFSFSSDKKIQMEYSDVKEKTRITFSNSENSPSVDKETIKTLSELNYIYRIKDGIISVLLESNGWKDVTLTRMDNAVWISNDNMKNEYTRKYDFTTEEFKKLLEIIAKVSMENGKFPLGFIDTNYTRNNYFFAIIGEIFKFILPEGFYQFYGPWVEVFYDQKCKNGFRWSGNKSNWWNVTLNVIQHFETIKSIPSLLDDSKYPDFQITIKK